MNESLVTVVGNVATPVEFRKSAGGVAVARFRLASTVRRFSRKSESWVDAYANFFTVWAWRSLAANLASSVSVGEPLLVTGRLRVRESEREGKQFAAAELTATAVGHDLSRGTSAFVRVSPARPGLVTEPRTSGRPARESSPGESPGTASGAVPEKGAPGQRASP